MVFRLRIGISRFVYEFVSAVQNVNYRSIEASYHEHVHWNEQTISTYSLSQLLENAITTIKFSERN